MAPLGCSMFVSKVIEFFPKNAKFVCVFGKAKDVFKTHTGFKNIFRKGCINGSKNSDKSGNALNSKSEEVSLGMRSSCYEYDTYLKIKVVLFCHNTSYQTIP